MPEAIDSPRPLSHAERGRRGGAGRQSKMSPTERQELARKAALASAAARVAANAPDLTPEQVTRLRAVLSPALATVRAQRAGAA